MRRRIIAGVSVAAVPFGDAARLLTLEEVGEVPGEARGAFCRLRPPPDLPAADGAAWADAVRREARAVRLLPSARSRVVPAGAVRESQSPRRGVSDEALDLARSAIDPALLPLVERVLAEVS